MIYVGADHTDLEEGMGLMMRCRSIENCRGTAAVSGGDGIVSADDS